MAPRSVAGRAPRAIPPALLFQRHFPDSLNSLWYLMMYPLIKLVYCLAFPLFGDLIHPFLPESQFSQFRGRRSHFLEISVSRGGGAGWWRRGPTRSHVMHAEAPAERSDAARKRRDRARSVRLSRCHNSSFSNGTLFGTFGTRTGSGGTSCRSTQRNPTEVESRLLSQSVS